MERRDGAPHRSRRKATPKLERRVVATIIAHPEEYSRLRPEFCACCVFTDPRLGYLATLAADAATEGRRAGAEELARRLWIAGPITRPGADLYVGEITLLRKVGNLRTALEDLVTQRVSNLATNCPN